jgi:hypothetical protein
LTPINQESFDPMPPAMQFSQTTRYWLGLQTAPTLRRSGARAYSCADASAAQGMLVVNAGSIGSPFREYQAGQQPELMPHAEYAGAGASRSTELRRVPLESGALRDSVSAVEHPLREWLVRQYGRVAAVKGEPLEFTPRPLEQRKNALSEQSAGLQGS